MAAGRSGDGGADSEQQHSPTNCLLVYSHKGASKKTSEPSDAQHGSKVTRPSLQSCYFCSNLIPSFNLQGIPHFISFLTISHDYFVFSFLTF